MLIGPGGEAEQASKKKIVILAQRPIPELAEGFSQPLTGVIVSLRVGSQDEFDTCVVMTGEQRERRAVRDRRVPGVEQ